MTEESVVWYVWAVIDAVWGHSTLLGGVLLLGVVAGVALLKGAVRIAREVVGSV